MGRAASPIRLIDTQGRSFQYVALSHCWGSAPQLTTTKSNWTQLASNISFTALPPLFQDAVIITRQLGLRYIWIDSLCIVQDSVRDWETESSKMGSIYQNSYITISATNSGNGSARCLAERQKPVKIPYQNTSQRDLVVRARRVLDHHPKDNPDGGPVQPIGPLSHRAWALQEVVLSTRVLHYTATELLFECRTSYRCECSPERKVWPTTPALIPRAVSSKNVGAVWDAWQRLVEQYSARDLTVATDKLPAISGIASKIHQATHSDYMAGVWRGNLALDMLWSATSVATRSATPCFTLETWRAPSFSWASLDTPVTYPRLDDDERESFVPTIVLLAASIVPKGLNTLGSLSAASITIRGPVIECTMTSEMKSDNWSYMLMIKGTSSISITPDCLLIDAEVEAADVAAKLSVRRAQPSDLLQPFSAAVLCLSVARYDNLVTGLVLGVSQTRSGAWERVGTFAVGTEAIQSAKERDITLL